MANISVLHEEGSRFTVNVRGHALTIDQPIKDGGTDLGPTPSELFGASLAGCVAYFAERFLERHQIDAEGLAVEASYAYAQEPPSRVSSIEIKVGLPEAFPAAKLEAFTRVIDRCTVHNSLKQPPAVDIAVVPRAVAA